MARPPAKMDRLGLVLSDPLTRLRCCLKISTKVAPPCSCITTRRVVGPNTREHLGIGRARYEKFSGIRPRSQFRFHAAVRGKITQWRNLFVQDVDDVDEVAVCVLDVASCVSGGRTWGSR